MGLAFLNLLLVGADLTLLFMIVRLITKQPKSMQTSGLNKRFRLVILLIIALGPIYSVASHSSPKVIMPLLVSCAVAVNYYFFLKHYYAYARSCLTNLTKNEGTTTANTLSSSSSSSASSSSSSSSSPLTGGSTSATSNGSSSNGGISLAANGGGGGGGSEQKMTDNKFLIKMHSLFSPTMGTAKPGDIRTSTSRIDNNLAAMEAAAGTTTTTTTTTTSRTIASQRIPRDDIRDDVMSDATKSPNPNNNNNNSDDINNGDDDDDDDDDGRVSRDENGFMRRRLPPMVVCLRTCLMVVLSSALPAYFFGTGAVIAANGPPSLKDSALLKADTALLGWLFPKGQLALWLDTNPVVGPSTVLGAIIVDLLTIVYVSYYLWSYVIMLIYVWRAISKERRKSLKSEVYAWDTVEAYMACWTLSFVLTFFVNILCPAKSPRIFIKDDYQNPLTGFGLRYLIGGVIHQDDSFGSFPSGHVGETLAVALAAYRVGLTPRFSKFCLIITFFVGVATLWLRYHYFVDVLAGTAVAFAALFLSGVKPVTTPPYTRRSAVAAAEGLSSSDGLRLVSVSSPSLPITTSASVTVTNATTATTSSISNGRLL